jgi:hypothetical protein
MVYINCMQVFFLRVLVLKLLTAPHEFLNNSFDTYGPVVRANLFGRVRLSIPNNCLCTYYK